MKAVQSSSWSSGGRGPPRLARTVSTKSVNPPTTIASAGLIPAPSAIAIISSWSAGANVSCAGRHAPANSSTVAGSTGPPLHLPEATRATRSSV